MADMTGSTTTSAAWTALVRHRDDGIAPLGKLLADDPGRATRLGIEVGDLWIDPSRQQVTDTTLALLADLADERSVAASFQRMMDGQPVNATEGIPALHTALRAPGHEVIRVGGVDVVPAVHATLDRMSVLATSIRDGRRTGATGEPITAVVSLGIGGSHLGPALAAEALSHLALADLTVRFSSSMDGADLVAALDGLEPASTLIVVCSKSFTTVETLTAAQSARAWLAEGLGVARAAEHVVAVTASPEGSEAFGIPAELTFELPQWVGGRFSLPSAVGLAVMVAIGPPAFMELLAGMRLVDEHVAAAPTLRNGPVLLGLIDVWNRSLLGRTSMAVVPYAHRLKLLPAYLQQLSMESLGKGTTLDGLAVDTPTGAVVWGAAGTDGQHAFFQLLHQGTDVVPCDLIGVARPAADPRGAHQNLLLANLAAQAAALTHGRTRAEVAAGGTRPDLVPHRTFAGNRPSTTILLPELTPSVLGQLLATYEHRTVTAATVWGIDPFDQWGVELGKELASRIAADPDGGDHDGSTIELLRRYRELRGT
jgi:glucose-6-phosphate isomerase